MIKGSAVLAGLCVLLVAASSVARASFLRNKTPLLWDEYKAAIQGVQSAYSLSSDSTHLKGRSLQRRQQFSTMTCPDFIGCAGGGSPSSPTLGNPCFTTLTQTQAGPWCNLDSQYCDEASRTCKTSTIMPNGEACAAPNQKCGEDADCNDDDICEAEPSVQGGQCCAGEGMCMNGDSCSQGDICSAVADGSACQDSDVCAPDSFCNLNSVCAKKPLPGETCGHEAGDSSPSVCGGNTATQGAHCAISNSAYTCVLFDYSDLKLTTGRGALGTACDDEFDCNSLYCNKTSNLCATPEWPSPSNSPSCSYPFGSNGANCDTCVCNSAGTSGWCFGSDDQMLQYQAKGYTACADQGIAFSVCKAGTNSSCPTDGSSGSCCCQEYKAFQSCMYSAWSMDIGAPYNCGDGFEALVVGGSDCSALGACVIPEESAAVPGATESAMAILTALAIALRDF